MTRFLILAFATLSISSIQAIGADPRFAMTAEASRRGDQILVQARITESKPDGTTSVISRPMILVPDGSRGYVTIGSAAPNIAPAVLRATGRSAPDARRATTSPELVPNPETRIESGLKMDVISVKGDVQVLIVTVVIEKGMTIWANATNVPIATTQPSGNR